MPQFLETILAERGVAQHLEFHQKRVNKVLKDFDIKSQIVLSNIVTPPHIEGKIRCRVLYDESSIEVSYHAYRAKTVHKFKTIELDKDFDYSYKYANRDFFNVLHEKHSEYHEFILIKNGLVSDCTIANLAFYDSNLKSYITPKNALLAGTTRDRLLQTGKIIEKDISVNELKNFDSIIMLNAMLGFYEIKNAIIH